MDFELLCKTQLFSGCSQKEIEQMMNSLKHTLRKYKKGQYIYRSGQLVKDVCVVLSGSVQIENIDVLGNKSILGISEAGNIFAESYACLPDQPMLVDVIARGDTQILFIKISSIFSEESLSGCGAKLIHNLLRISSRKNINLSMRIFHSAPKTIRARLYSYFSEQISVQGTNNIKIPMDRQQLADYLGVERTALSKELGKMKAEGLLDFHKNHFSIIVENQAE